MKKKLTDYNLNERTALACELIQEQIVDQRVQLHRWRELTFQPAQIDTGYIGQHLVSLISGIVGGGFRGKGDDLEDGSEVKSANFLDSEDAKGAVAPRWNFQCNDEEGMESFLSYPSIFLVSVDLSPENNQRFRIWKVNPREHQNLNERYHEWMDVLGRPKLQSPDRPGVNFQLFPPRNKSNDTYARHGNGRSNGFTKIQIELDDIQGSNKIFHAEVINNDVILIK
ncbi:MamI family restriction endonuclease [Sulfurospirillum arcachonense]|uniref:MamI family restriction endonuclease n=1 Tax=Sulfurospirillum arcachonense TaxID=57666 RepID=UPI00046AE5BE|nr:MamI family restriction endonuclease [Sulfurospirillum arcachonense]